MQIPVIFRRRLRRAGNSEVVAIPPELFESLGWKDREFVAIRIVDDTVVLRRIIVGVNDDHD